MTLRDGKSDLLGESGEFDFPGANAIPVGPASVGGDEQRRGVLEALAAHLAPPAPDGLDCELRGVRGVAHVDPALVVRDDVDAVEDDLGVLTECGVLEVVDRDALG